MNHKKELLRSPWVERIKVPGLPGLPMESSHDIRDEPLTKVLKGPK